MRRLRALLLRLLPPGIGGAALDDLESEIRLRREGGPPRAVEPAWYLLQGLALATHLRAARLVDAVRDSSHGDGTMEPLARNLGLAARRLRRSPGFAAAAVLTLALGIGANVAVFTVVDAVLLEPLPYEEPDELVALWEWNQPRDRRENVANPGNVRAWTERSETLEDVAATVFFDQPMLMESGEGPREVMVRLATPNFFDVLGVEAAAGRTFSPAAGESEGSEIVLTDGYWRREHGGDPGVIGRSLTFSSGLTGTVVGVLPPAYLLWSEGSAMFVSYGLQGDQTNTGRFLNTIARLQEGATVAGAQEELEAIAAGLRAEHPEFNAGWSVNVVPLREQVVGGVERVLWVLLASVALLLLIACSNVSNLYLARATARRREMAVRSSLGASRRNLAGQLLAEGALTAALGAFVGVAVAWAATHLLASRLPQAFQLPRADAAAIDGRVLLFALAVTCGAVLIFALVPAMHTAEATPGEALAAESRGPGRASGRARSLLVVTQMALSVPMLVGAGLLARSFGALVAEDLGIEPENVLTARVSLGTPMYGEGGARAQFLETFVERVARIPGVEAAGVVPFLPLDGQGSATSYWAGDRPVPAAGERPVTDVRNVAGDYFVAMGIALVRGRTFDARDGADDPLVAVVSRALAEESWPGEDPIGRPLVLSWGDPSPVATVIGVVEDVRLASVETEPRAAVYFPVAQFPEFGAFHVVVRSTRDPAELHLPLAQALHEADPSLALSNVRPMSRIVSGATARPRMSAILMVGFACVAAALSMVGLYGVLSYAVAQRTREIGLRLALGAHRGRVVTGVVGQGMALVAVGLVLGLAGALGAGRLLASLLYGVEPADPVAMTGAASLLAVSALVACIVPALRATRIDPARALRVE